MKSIIIMSMAAMALALPQRGGGRGGGGNRGGNHNGGGRGGNWGGRGWEGGYGGYGYGYPVVYPYGGGLIGDVVGGVAEVCFSILSFVKILLYIYMRERKQEKLTVHRVLLRVSLETSGVDADGLSILRPRQISPLRSPPSRFRPSRGHDQPTQLREGMERHLLGNDGLLLVVDSV
jgi:hypothetical protein